MLWQDVRLGSNGPRTPSAPDPLLLPAFTRVDLGIQYRAGRHVDLSLNVENLLDELIFVSGTVGSSLELASPRAHLAAPGVSFLMRRVLLLVHLCAGLTAGAVILVMSVTGVLLTYERQITEWADGYQ